MAQYLIGTFRQYWQVLPLRSIGDLCEKVRGIHDGPLRKSYCVELLKSMKHLQKVGENIPLLRPVHTSPCSLSLLRAKNYFLTFLQSLLIKRLHSNCYCDR